MINTLHQLMGKQGLGPKYLSKVNYKTVLNIKSALIYIPVLATRIP